MANVDHLLPRVGERIGSYQLVHELARGGFSVVFRAIQVSLQADVAIKFLAPPNLGQVRSQQLLERFQQEARVAQQLQHPCAIKVRDYGRTPTGLMYLVTDFIDGRMLTDVLKEQPLSVARTVRIASQVLGCLVEAHGLGIVHRDLKPDNIMLRDFSAETDVVTVLDFGVAKVSESHDGVVTQVGMTLGTPYYTAPEQCRGEKDIDGRADLYALGLIIAECLTGRRVVGTDNAMAAVFTHAGAQPLEFEPVLHQSPLFPVIQRATQKKKEWRYADAARMREALELAAGYGQPFDAPVTTKPVHQAAVHEAASLSGSSGQSWFEQGPPPSSPGRVPAGTLSGAPPAVSSSAVSSPVSPPAAGAVPSPAAPAPWAFPPTTGPQTKAHPVLRPRRQRMMWLWMLMLVVVGAVIVAMLSLLLRERAPEPVSNGLDEPRAREERVPVIDESAEVPEPVVEPRGGGPVRARIHYVADEGSERRVTLNGCGLASGLLVGERAPVGDTGLDLEITRLRDATQCTARTAATASQLEGIGEVVFRGRSTPR